MRIAGALAFSIFMAVSALIIGIAGSPALFAGQRAARSVIKFWARGVLWALKTFTGVDYHIEGAENLPDDGAVVASNHQSMWETLALYVLLPNPVMIFKKELSHIPVYGWWAHPAGNIPIDRKGGARALRVMSALAAERIKEGAQIVVFPEGTRMQPGERGAYHPGVAGIYKAANAPCVPVAHDSGSFWRHPGLAKTPGDITLKFLTPIPAGIDRKDFLRRLKVQIDGARPDLATDGEEGNKGHD